MTSVSQQSQPNQASTSSNATSSVPSYASATKKSASSPPVATGSSTQSPVVAVSGSEPVQQNGKSSSTPPVNGRAQITPAVPSLPPAIAHSNSADHNRKSSVNLPANGGFSNGGPMPAGAQKASIQFGSITDSPAASHSTPQPAQSNTSAPINIPGNPRVTSPAQSPSPIPTPAASGGRPPSGISSNGIAFGSLGGDGDRHMRQGSSGSQLTPGAQQPHLRRESSGEMGHQQGPPTPGRGGFQGGRGRGGYNNNNNNGSYNQQQQPMYNPNAQFRPNPSNQARGGMPPFQGQGRPMQYPGSPHQPTRSPALSHSIPGTPNMGQAMPMASPQQYGTYQGYHMPGPQPVLSSSSFAPYSPDSSLNYGRGGGHGKKGKSQKQSSYHKDHKAWMDTSYGQRDGPRDISGQAFVPANATDQHGHSQRSQTSESDHTFFQGPPLSPNFITPSAVPVMDFSPESGNFDQYLTQRQNYQGYQGYDGRNMGMMMQGNPYQMQYPQMQFMNGPPQSPQPGYQQPYMQGQPHNMSRTSSQMSTAERPNSSLGQPQTPSQTPSVATPQQSKPATVTSTFERPKKSKAILIKRPDGSPMDLPVAKAPASPALSIRAQTPPVASTPTPPPKPSTPLHQRTDSNANSGKTQEEIRNEFKEKMKRAAAEEKESKAKDDDKSTVVPVESTVVSTPKEEAEPVSKPAEESKVEAAAADVEDPETAAARQKAEEEATLEREIEEMEAAEAAREKAEEERQAKRMAEKAAAEKANAEKRKTEAEENDRKLREQEREMERLEDEREKKRLAAESSAETGPSVAEALAAQKDDGAESKDAPATPSTLAAKLASLNLETDSGASTPVSDASMGPPKLPASDKRDKKPTALNLAPLNTKPVEAPQPSAALQSLKSARFLRVINNDLYPEGIKSPAPGVNDAVASKGKSFKYDTAFLLQFQKVFTEKPSMEFESQIKNLIGDTEPGSARSARAPSGMGPRQGSNRAPGNFVMGQFGSSSQKPLPPGTSSAERFAMSQGQMPRPGSGPMGAPFNRPGAPAFGSGSNPMARVPSSSGMGSMTGGSGRNQFGRTSQRGSKQYKDTKGEAQAAKTMPLTAGMDLKPIAVTASGWKPRSLVGQSATGAAGPAPGSSGGHMEPDMVQRKVKAALNKMTPEKFEKIADQILAIAAQSKDEADGRTLRQVIQLTFEKATDEAHWASMYAKFCKRMLETMSPDIKDESILDKNGNVVSGGNLFRKYLLNRCQEEFERGWQVNLPEKPEGEQGDEHKTEEAAMLSDEYYIAATAKRRGLGLVQFIGELYKLGMLTERIMHECVKKLVDYTGIPDEAEIESLTKLLKTIGGNLDSTEKGHPMMDVYFQRIQAMIDTPELPSRLRFMLMDIVDLRKKHWQSKETNKGPKTLEEVRAEVEAAAAAKAAENARGNQRGGGRMQGGRGDARNFSNQYGNQPPPDYNKNTVASDDLRRLGKSASARTQGGPMSFGPTSMFSSRSNSNRKMGPGGSLSRPGEDSGASSRTGTPPQQREKEPITSANAFAALQQDDNNDAETPASPPSVQASPAANRADLSSDAKETES